MSESNNIQNQSPDYYNQDLTLIYKQISIEDDMLFDVNEEKQTIINNIEICFDSEFLCLLSDNILENQDNLNKKFVSLIKYCVNQKRPNKKIHIIFIEFCDYFDMPYNKTYNILHEKIQILIKNGFIKMIGGKKAFNKLNDKFNPENSNVLSLFDMIKK